MIFRIGNSAIIAQNHRTIGTIEAVKPCLWFKVNTKAARANALDGVVFPHIIRFSYTIDGREYEGRQFVNYTTSPPPAGSSIDVFYDKNKPSRCAVKL